MKKLFYVLAIILGVATVSSFRITGDLLSRIGCADEIAKIAVFENFYNANINPPGCDGVYKTILVADRTEIVNQLFEYIKAYVNSGEFRSKYTQALEEDKPKEPEKEVVAPTDDQTKEMLKSMEDQLNNPYLTAEQKEELKKNLETMRQTIATPEYQQMSKQATDMAQKMSQDEYEKEMAEYKTELAEWEKMKDIKYMLKKRLQAFLELTSSMNFDAKLIKQNDKMKFEDPALESKSREWKLCFRSGRETIMAARTCASKWLKELGQ
jgi:hypothetical protein